MRNSSAVKENFAKVVAFNKEYMKLHDLIADTISHYSEYWYEYLKPSPSTFPPSP